MDPAEKIGPILKLLEEYYGEAHCTLDFTNPLELLVATVLSAQCTDVRVNLVTPAIFSRYPTAAHYADADLNGPGAGYLHHRFLPSEGQEPQGHRPGPGGEVRRTGAGFPG